MLRVWALASVLLAGGAATAVGQARREVTQENKKFIPAKLTVQRGDTIVFVNHDAVVHNVFSETPGFEFNLKRQSVGQSAAVPFTQVGVAEIRCAIHPGMRLTITVR